MAIPMLNEEIRRQAQEILSDMELPVEIVYFGQESGCEYCAETLQLLQEVADLSDRIHLQVHDLHNEADLAREYNMDKAPGFVLAARKGKEIVDYGIRYAGIPVGHEFTSLINDLLLVSKQDSSLSEETRQFLRGLDTPVHLQVFVTPTCAFCPRMVVLAHQFALESPLVQAEMVEALEFRELSDQYGVTGVPHISINHGLHAVIGSTPEDQLVAEIRRALSLSQQA